MRVRLLVHALDRTGPPVLAGSVGRWLSSHRPGWDLDVVAFRGGPLAEDLAGIGPVTVLLRDDEPWDHTAPDPVRRQEVAALGAALSPADALLLVSVAGGQCLSSLPEAGAVVTWCVEQGEDLHWVTDLPDLRPRTDRWLAGSAGSLRELSALVSGAEVHLAPEFVDPPPSAAVAGEAGAAVRRHLGLADGDLLVVGAGIATVRKAPDLFLEVAVALGRSSPGVPATFVWVGGDRDPLYPVVAEEAARLGLGERFRLVPPVPDVVPWLAAADVVLHPARLDAFPLVCLHAAAVGTPVVAFRGAGGVEEMFGPAFLGAGYPDVRGLADEIARLADPIARSAAGSAQRTQVERRWLVDVGAPRIAEHLEQAVAER